MRSPEVRLNVGAPLPTRAGHARPSCESTYQKFLLGLCPSQLQGALGTMPCIRSPHVEGSHARPPVFPTTAVAACGICRAFTGERFATRPSHARGFGKGVLR